MHVYPKKVLVVRRDNIGDLVCTTPLFTSLKMHFPDLWIGVLANSYNAPVLLENPDIDSVFVYTKTKHLRSGENHWHALWQRLQLIRYLRKQQIDDVILPSSKQSSAQRFARWISPKRIVTPPLDASGHEVERCIACLRAYNISDIIKPPCKVVANIALTQKLQANLPPFLTVRRWLIALHISARKPRQRWPINRFAELTRRLYSRHNCGFIIFWSPGTDDNSLHPGDDTKISELTTKLHGIPFMAMPTNSLSELVAGLSICNEIICADGGAMHIAAGLGKPIVCLFGDSDPLRWHPWNVPYVLLQSNNSKNVIDISVDEVMISHMRLLSEVYRLTGRKP